MFVGSSIKVLLPVLIPLVGLLSSNFFFISHQRRCLIITCTAIAAIHNIVSLKIRYPVLACLTGFATAWAFMRTFILFWILTPQRDCVQLNYKRYYNGRQESPKCISYPASLWERLLWCLGIFFDNRAIGWCYHSHDGHLCQFHQNDVHKRIEATESQRLTAYNVAMISARLLLSVAYIHFYCSNIVPWLRPKLLEIYSHSSNTTKQLPFWVRILETLTSFFSLVSLIDIVYTGSRLYSALRLIVRPGTSVFCSPNPSPWGHPSAVAIQGLAGFWTSWQNYFQFSFRLTATYLTNSISLSLNKTAQQTLRILIAFAISGLIHMCASIMFRCDNNLGGFVFLFFLLQPFGIIICKALLTMLQAVHVHPLLISVFNILFTLLWLFFTLPALFEDNIVCGFWGE